jgi:P27 family predicted phage terminase small subunit
MPTAIQKATEKIGVGAVNGGKHWTKDEVENRQEAEKALTRKSRIVLKAPKWLSDEALLVWKDVRKKLIGIELLDNLDTDLLGVYCDAVAKYQALSKKERILEEDTKALQSWARIIVNYAEKLGLSPGGRARLAKKRAQKVTDGFGEEFD